MIAIIYFTIFIIFFSICCYIGHIQTNYNKVDMRAIGPNIKPDIGGIYIHLNSGNKYVVTAIGKTKLPGIGWADSVTYVREDGSTTTPYTRTMSDFQSSFADSGDYVIVE